MVMADDPHNLEATPNPLFFEAGLAHVCSGQCPRLPVQDHLLEVVDHGIPMGPRLQVDYNEMYGWLGVGVCTGEPSHQTRVPRDHLVAALSALAPCCEHACVNTAPI